ncbi:MAG: hypothetical protein DHS20C21_20100 [Gemmatimonadota bacterium]|nr:MAG: hypothetical protein DHS20C21_20100 [Gemmatimonadota bacterium]
MSDTPVRTEDLSEEQEMDDVSPDQELESSEAATETRVEPAAEVHGQEDDGSTDEAASPDDDVPTDETASDHDDEPTDEVAADHDDEPTDEAAADHDDESTDEVASELSEEEQAEVDRLIDGRTEAILFSSEVPLTVKRLGQILRLGKREMLESIDRLNVFYGETGRAFRISPLAGGFQIVTVPEHAELLGKLHKERVPTRLSRAALETLSIIAFKQPVTRGEVDAIRGVSASDRVLRHLIERKLVRISGRAEAPGRPLLYGTTREFLAYFGLSAVADLPRTEELDALLAGDVPRSAMDDEETQDSLLPLEDFPSQGEESGEEPAIKGMMEDAELAMDSEDNPSEAPESLPAEDGDMSHSGEESDDHAGNATPQ